MPDVHPRPPQGDLMIVQAIVALLQQAPEIDRATVRSSSFIARPPITSSRVSGGSNATRRSSRGDPVLNLSTLAALSAAFFFAAQVAREAGEKISQRADRRHAEGSRRSYSSSIALMSSGAVNVPYSQLIGDMRDDAPASIPEQDARLAGAAFPAEGPYVMLPAASSSAQPSPSCSAASGRRPLAAHRHARARSVRRQSSAVSRAASSASVMSD